MLVWWKLWTLWRIEWNWINFSILTNILYGFVKHLSWELSFYLMKVFLNLNKTKNIVHKLAHLIQYLSTKIIFRMINLIKLNAERPIFSKPSTKVFHRLSKNPFLLFIESLFFIFNWFTMKFRDSHYVIQWT